MTTEKTVARATLLSAGLLAAAVTTGLFAAMLNTATADAAQRFLTPMKAATVAIGGQTAVAYHTIDRQGRFQVVVTMAPAGGAEGPAARFEAELEDGAAASLLLDSGPGTSPSLRLRRVGDRLGVQAFDAHGRADLAAMN